MATRLNTQGQKSREAKETVAEPKSRSGRLIQAVIAGLVLLGAGAGGAAWYFSHVHDSAATDKPPIFVNLDTITVNLDTFTVNLQSEYNDQHLQTNLALKVTDNPDVDLIKAHIPEVRNRILLVLSSKSAAQILTAEGKRKLASELASEINQPFSEARAIQPVESVLFTSFVIQ